MGTDKVVFEGVLPEVTWPEVTEVTWRDWKWRQSHDRKRRQSRVRKYVIRMCNRKLRNIRLNVAFWPEVTSVTWPEEALSGRGPDRQYVLRMPGFFPGFFLSSSNMATGCNRRFSQFKNGEMYQRSYSVINRRCSLVDDQQLVKFINIFQPGSRLVRQFIFNLQLL
jgi:hypothetical protein